MKNEFWSSDGGVFLLVCIVICTFLSMTALAISIACLPSVILGYKIKMRGLDVVAQAVDKGLELTINGDILKGMELIKVESK